MIPSPEFGDAKPVDSRLTDLSKNASSLGYEIVDIAGFLDSIDEKTRSQLGSLASVRRGAANIKEANTQVRTAVETVTEATKKMKSAVDTSSNDIRAASEQTKDVATWVKAIDARMTTVEDTLKGVQKNNSQISKISSQVNILAINAKIEAARAGDAGRGFAVVAEAINELSLETAAAAEGIADNINVLSGWIKELKDEAGAVSEKATEVISGAQMTDDALNGIAESVEVTYMQAEQIAQFAENVGKASDDFEPGFNQIGTAIEETAERVHRAYERVEGLIDRSENMVQGTVELGGATDDLRFIQFVQSSAQKVMEAIDAALAAGDISQAELFSTELRDIPGTNPAQKMAPFTAFFDRILPAIQEPALEIDKRVVFCACVNRIGYLSTHNRKFSQKPSHDPAWNTANCRNRRIFDDRVGLKSGNNSEPFLLQVYRREMGGGEFSMMKDVSAPIKIGGKLWGGIRLAYLF